MDPRDPVYMPSTTVQSTTGQCTTDVVLQGSAVVLVNDAAQEKACEAVQFYVIFRLIYDQLMLKTLIYYKFTVLIPRICI